MKRLAPLLLAVPLLLAGCSQLGAEPTFQQLREDQRQEIKESCSDAVQGEVEDHAKHSYGQWELYEDWDLSERRTDGGTDTYMVDSQFTPNDGVPITFSCQIDRTVEDGSLEVLSTTIANPTQPAGVTPSSAPESDQLSADELGDKLDDMLGIDSSPDAPLTFMLDGTYRVGEDVVPGTYEASEAGTSCYWARLSGLSGETSDIIANESRAVAPIVTLAENDVAFQASNCGLWMQVD